MHCFSSLLITLQPNGSLHGHFGTAVERTEAGLCQSISCENVIASEFILEAVGLFQKPLPNFVEATLRQYCSIAIIRSQNANRRSLTICSAASRQAIVWSGARDNTFSRRQCP
jgi:hypothetical protein